MVRLVLLLLIAVCGPSLSEELPENTHVNNLSIGQQKQGVLTELGSPDGVVELERLTGPGISVEVYDVDQDSNSAELIIFYSLKGRIVISGFRFRSCRSGRAG